MEIDIVFHPSGDWEGLYINGKLITEGHNIEVRDLVDALNSYEDTQDLPYNLMEFNLSQWNGDIKKEKCSRIDSDGEVDEWEDYPSNMPNELPNRL